MNNNYNTDDLVWVTLNDPDDFHKIVETLTRIGITNNDPENKAIWQSCHILHKRERYAIVHFKELFALDGKPTNISTEDLNRRNYIVRLLVQWNLCELENPSLLDTFPTESPNTTILKYSDKSNWDLKSKYDLGTFASTQVAM